MSYALLSTGIALWVLPHWFKRIAPGPRAAMGDAGKGIVAALTVLGVVLMVIGYRGAPVDPVYAAPGWGVHLNNLLMLVAIFLFGAGSSKGRARGWFRHPMLLGFTVWAVAHLLVNGDLASLMLFGGLGAWALITMIVINRATPDWHRPPAGAIGGDIRLVVITLVLFAVITAIHSYFVWPFPG